MISMARDRVKELSFENGGPCFACDCRPVLSDCTSLPRVRDGEEKRRGEDAEEEEGSRSSCSSRRDKETRREVMK